MQTRLLPWATFLSLRGPASLVPRFYSPQHLSVINKAPASLVSLVNCLGTPVARDWDPCTMLLECLEATPGKDPASW